MLYLPAIAENDIEFATHNGANYCKFKKIESDTMTLTKRKNVLVQPAKLPKQIKICPICGKQFVANRHAYIYCSVECRVSARKEQQRLAQLKYSRSFLIFKNKKMSNATDAKVKVPLYIEPLNTKRKWCIWCGKFYDEASSTATKLQNKFCSEKCREQRQQIILLKNPNYSQI